MKNNTYGLTPKEIKETIKKLKANLLFLFNTFIYIGNDDDGIALGNITSNAILHTNRYVGNIYNRVETLTCLAKERQLVNMMITLTISSKKIRRDTKASLKELSDMFRKITKDRSWSNIDKDHRIYFKVIEPQKSGTPHMHILLWVPKNDVSSLIKKIYDLYPAPAAKVTSVYIPDDFKPYKENLFSKKEYFHKEKGKPIVKIKKHNGDKKNYLLKQFHELEHNIKCIQDIDKVNNISLKTLWYSHHKVTRITTSQSLIPEEIYKKIYWYDDNLLRLTKLYNKGEISVLHLNEEMMTNKKEIKKVKKIRLILYKNLILWSKPDSKLKQLHTRRHHFDQVKNVFNPNDATSNILHYGVVEKLITDNDLSTLRHVICQKKKSLFQKVSNVS